MAEPARKTIVPVRDETAENPRPQPVAPAEKRSKTATPGADKVRRFAAATAFGGACSHCCRLCCSSAFIST